MLKRFIPFAHAQSIFEIDLSFYQKLGIKYVFVDLDNTLDSYKQATPLEPAKKLKEDLENAGIELIIVSNNRGKRVQKCEGFCFIRGGLCFTHINITSN